MSRSKSHKKPNTSQWYTVRSILGYKDIPFKILLGGREAGKSYAVMAFFLGQWKKQKKDFTWLRLTEGSQKKLLANNGAELIDKKLRDRYDLDIKVKGHTVYDHGEEMCKVLALSTFYNDKGVALFDATRELGYNICLDEMNRESNEKNTFDICYAFVNQLENLVRSSKKQMNIFLIGNTLQEASDLMCLFEFIPQQFGRYVLHQWKTDYETKERYLKKTAVVDYIPPSEKYKKRRQDSIADILMPNASTFTNEVIIDNSLVFTGRLTKPNYIIKFSRDQNDWFTVWNDRVIARYNGEKCKESIAMKPYENSLFNVELRDMVIQSYDSRYFWYHNLFTQKTFTRYLSILKPRKH